MTQRNTGDFEKSPTEKKSLAEDIAGCFSHGQSNQETYDQLCYIRDTVEPEELIGVIRDLMERKSE